MGINVTVKKELEKVLSAIKNDRTLLCNPNYPKSAGIGERSITVENIADLAGNHLFDDHPELFGITKSEGHNVRAYFQRGQMTGHYDFISDLYLEFPTFFEHERESYMKHVNEYRASLGKNPISLPNNHS